jgi:hypothetical protein
MMTTERFLQNLFEGYVRTFASFRWYKSANYADLTAKELNHFSELGERLGYVVRREMNWHYPRDLCWVGSDDIPFLYLERESKNSRMKHTVEKMLNQENSGGIPIMVASFGHLTDDSFAKASEMFRHGIQDKQSALLYAWVGKSENAPEYEIRANVFTNGSCTSAKATPSMTNEEAPYWSMRFVGGNDIWY